MGPLSPLGASDIMGTTLAPERLAAPLRVHVPYEGPCRRGLELRRVRRPYDGRGPDENGAGGVIRISRRPGAVIHRQRLSQ